jgi:hypothetical protein
VVQFPVWRRYVHLGRCKQSQARLSVLILPGWALHKTNRWQARSGTDFAELRTFPRSWAKLLVLLGRLPVMIWAAVALRAGPSSVDRELAAPAF